MADDGYTCDDLTTVLKLFTRRLATLNILESEAHRCAFLDLVTLLQYDLPRYFRTAQLAAIGAKLF